MYLKCPEENVPEVYSTGDIHGENRVRQAVAQKVLSTYSMNLNGTYVSPYIACIVNATCCEIKSFEPVQSSPDTPTK